MEPILFKPLYQERVWGGKGLAELLGRELPDGDIGESWEIVDRPEAQSVAINGTRPGVSLRKLIEADSAALLGPDYDSSKPFPILVKWLDCQERLSLQVHPPADIAPELGGEPKTENWYIVRARGDAAVLAGLQPGVTRDQFEKALKNNELEPLVCRMPTREGDSLFVPSGRIHAIDGGNVILEIQQNSDTTYRVYDWGRPREIHVEKSMKSIDFNDFEPTLTHHEDGAQTLVESDVFRLRKFDLSSGDRLDFGAGEEARLIHVVSGTIRDGLNGYALKMGDNALLPYNEAFAFVAEPDARVLVTDQFA